MRHHIVRKLRRVRQWLGSMIVFYAITSSTAHASRVSSKFSGSDTASEDRFGYSVAMSGNTAIIGAPGDNAQGTLSGSAYVFTLVGSSWVQQAKLTPSDGAARAGFGRAVALSGDTALVGAPNAAITGTETGAVYVFVRSGTTWSEQAKLVALDYVVFDGFGSNVSLSGGTAAIGSPYADAFGENSGAAYVFVRSGTSWSQQAKIIPIDGRSLDLFGSSVSLSGETLAVGSPADDDNAVASGSAYVFLRTGLNWGQQQKIRPADGLSGDLFGTGITVDGDTLVVGSPDDDDNGLASGSAYVFTRGGTSWSLQTKIMALDASAGDFFGATVSLRGDNLLIGAFLDDRAVNDSGSVYAYQRSGTTWSQLNKLSPASSSAGDNFGVAVALDGDQGLAGTEQDDGRGSNSGAVYPFTFAIAAAPALGSYASLLALALFLGGGLLIGARRRAVAREG